MNPIRDIYFLIYAINFMTILGSIFSFVIYSRKAFEKSTIRIYCRALAIFDLFMLVPFLVGFIGALQNISITTENDFWCKFVNFIAVGLSPIPGWILVVFSFDRLIAVSMTKRFEFAKKKWFQYSLIAGLFIFHCGLYSPVFVLVGILNFTTSDGSYKSTSCDTTSLVIPIIYLVESSIVPFIIIIITTAWIVRLLIKSRRRTSVAQELGNRRRSITIKGKELKFAFNSVALNVLLVVLLSPFLFHYIFPEEDYYLNDVVTTFCFMFAYLNYALHFWVHLVVNSVFRNEVLVILRIRKVNDGTRSMSTKISKK